MGSLQMDNGDQISNLVDLHILELQFCILNFNAGPCYKEIDDMIFFLSEEPKNVSKALKHPGWVDAMQDELNQFARNKVWRLCHAPYGKAIIGSKWVFRNKRDEIGIVIKNKARLVAQGYNQQECIDYNETFAPVPIFCDNTSAIAISNKPVLYSRTKHIDIRYHFIRDHILKGDVELHFIPSKYQLADIFTKPLDEPTFKRLIVELDQIEFTFEEIAFTTNNEVALLYPSHLNSEYFREVSDFISKCCLKEAFIKAPTQYKEYLSEFWYTAKTLDESKIWISNPTGGIRGDIGYSGEIRANGTLKKSFLPPRWRLLMGQIIQCLGGKTGATSEEGAHPQLNSGMPAFNSYCTSLFSFFHLHSESASGHDASANSTDEAYPRLYAPNDSIPAQ
ncbi:retrovirus-related pol polyprotein from transposon TNT 1-94 [Tanacetum coccineum]